MASLHRPVDDPQNPPNLNTGPGLLAIENGLYAAKQSRVMMLKDGLRVVEGFQETREWNVNADPVSVWERAQER